MPANLVKTEKDEKMWSRAKARAAEEGHARDWPYVTAIFQRMKGVDKTAALIAKVAWLRRST